MNSAALRPVTPQVVSDPQAVEVAYQNDVYDPRRDVRNQYPMIAQKMLLDPEMREGLTKLAMDVCDSGMYGFKSNDRDLAAVRMVAIKGFAMGMDLPRALETIKVIHGTPTIRGPQALHLIRERTRNSILECITSSEEKAVWKLARPGEKPKTFTATREQINKAGLPKKNNLWNVYGARMLKWHAFSEGAQELFGDVLMGCYISEEMQLQAQFDRELDSAVRQSESRGRGGGGGGDRSKPKQQAKGKDKGRAANKSEDSGSKKSGGEKSQSGSPKVDQERRLVLGGKLAEVARKLGFRKPTEDMNEDQQKLVKQEWDNQRELLWEEVSKTALDGKVAKSESLTVSEFELLATELDRRLAEMPDEA